MYNYKVAICDDEVYYREEIHRLLATYQAESGHKLCISNYDSGEKLLRDINDNTEFQIIILDIEMDGILGTIVAKEIRKKDENVLIIFATNHDEFALDAFEVEAAGYLLKPVIYTKLKSIINKALINIDFLKDKVSDDKRYLNVIMNYENIIIDINCILYIEKRRNISIIHTKDKEYSCYETLVDIYKKLNTFKFVYCHQGFIINFDEVKEVCKNSILFNSHHEVPVSRKYYISLRTRFIEKINNQIRYNSELELL